MSDAPALSDDIRQEDLTLVGEGELALGPSGVEIFPDEDRSVCPSQRVYTAIFRVVG
jgi:hypothetical protein